MTAREAVTNDLVGAGVFEVRSPYDNALVGTVRLSAVEGVEGIIDRAQVGAGAAATLPRSSRAEILFKAAGFVEARAALLARTISREAGKTIRPARKGVARLMKTLATVG